MQQVEHRCGSARRVLHEGRSSSEACMGHTHAAAALQRTYWGAAAKVYEGPVVLPGTAEDVAGLDIAVGVPEVVEAPQRTNGVTQHLQCRPD